MNYRADIDGLRAFAVLSVVLYHLGLVQLCPSGYSGVDIFFVISGYLITSILYKKISCAPELSIKELLLDFYERRVRRILPVFFFVVLTTLILSYFFFVNKQLKELCNSTLSVVGFCANFFFLGDHGYFALESHSKPFLHIWSLAIEEQFYIFFPLLLFFLVKKRKNTLKILSFITLVSFISCVVVSYINQKVAFYLLPFRAWELLLGSLLAVATMTRGQNSPLFNIKKTWKVHALSFVALVLLILSVTSLEYITPVFPSYVALLPCVAALLCIELGKNKGTLVYKVLSLKPFVALGKISYSLYLWHWIVIVFFINTAGHGNVALSLQQQVVYIGVMVMLSVFSYFCIEQPIRKKKIFIERKALFLTMLFCAILLCLFSVALKKGYVPLVYKSKYETKEYTDIHCKLGHPVTGIQNLFQFGDLSVEPTLFVTGDSHCAATYEMFDFLAKQHGLSGLLYTSQTPLFNTVSHSNINIQTTTPQQILEEQEKVKSYLSTKKIKSVCFVVRWTRRMYGKTIYLMEPSSNQTLWYIHNNGSIDKDSPRAVLTAVTNMVDFFRGKNVQFFYQKNLPEFSQAVVDIAAKLDRQGESQQELYYHVTSLRSDYENLHKETFEDLELFNTLGIQEIDITDDMCDDTYCYGLTPEGMPRFVDRDHISKYGAMEFRDEYLPFILSGK